MSKVEYAEYLLKHMAAMLKRNKESEIVYSKLKSKFKKCHTQQERQNFYNALTCDEQRAWDHSGAFYTKAELRRTRIMIAKVLLELERGKE